MSPLKVFVDNAAMWLSLVIIAIVIILALNPKDPPAYS